MTGASSTSDLIFDLEQGWAKGLRISFLGAQTSSKMSLSNCFLVKQIHGCNVASWTDLTPGVSPQVEADGIFSVGDCFKGSSQKLVIKTADCMPLVYVDREKESVVVVHAGWRGLAKNIHKVPFERGLCVPRSTWVWLGPCLNGQNFQVKEDMWSQFSKDCNDELIFSKSSLDINVRYFQSWAFIRREFERLGVELFYNVEVDTFCDKAFVSWRRAQKAGLDRLSIQNYTTVEFC